MFKKLVTNLKNYKVTDENKVPVLIVGFTGMFILSAVITLLIRMIVGGVV